MAVDGWKYYNHAAIPTNAPHETPDLEPIESGLVWSNIGGGVLHYWLDGHQTGIVGMKQIGGM